LYASNFYRWSAAAAVVILLGSGIWYFTRNKNTNDLPQPVAKIEKPAADTPAGTKPSVAVPVDTSSSQLAVQENVKPKEERKKTQEPDAASKLCTGNILLCKIDRNKTKRIKKT